MPTKGEASISLYARQCTAPGKYSSSRYIVRAYHQQSSTRTLPQLALTAFRAFAALDACFTTASILCWGCFTRGYQGKAGRRHSVVSQRCFPEHPRHRATRRGGRPAGGVRGSGCEEWWRDRRGLFSVYHGDGQPPSAAQERGPGAHAVSAVDPASCRVRASAAAALVCFRYNLLSWTSSNACRWFATSRQMSCRECFCSKEYWATHVGDAAVRIPEPRVPRPASLLAGSTSWFAAAWPLQMGATALRPIQGGEREREGPPNHCDQRRRERRW